jgi:hypothetical protein
MAKAIEKFVCIGNDYVNKSYKIYLFITFIIFILFASYILSLNPPHNWKTSS